MEPSNRVHSKTLTTYDVPNEQGMEREEHAVKPSRIAWQVVEHQRQGGVIHAG